MESNFLGQLMLFPFGFVPKGWAACQGQLLPIAQNQALFSLLGTAFGGDGVTNFALPNLSGRAPLGASDSMPLGSHGGEESHTLTLAEVPAHSHALNATSNSATLPKARNNLLAASSPAIYRKVLPNTNESLKPGTIASAGGNQPHENRSPFLALNWCIAIQGIYPTQSGSGPGIGLDVFLGSAMLVPYTFAPSGTAFCKGQLLPISAYTALFSLLGATYGGNATTNFALPNLQGMIVVGQGQAPGMELYEMGGSGGNQNVTLDSHSIPPHNHTLMATLVSADSAGPANSGLATTTLPTAIYSGDATTLVPMAQSSVQPMGSGQPHNNMMPYVAFNWVIALNGIYPPRS